MFLEVRTVLELREISKTFASHRAVNSVSFSIREGEFFSLVGPSGCGKTTTLRLIAGFEEPTTGEILLDGGSLAKQKPYQRNVSTVFQNYALFPHLCVAKNVAFGLSSKPELSRLAIRDKVARILAIVQLTGKESRLPSELSGGERQRVALARSLVLEPRVLLLDEPLSALDPNLRKQMRRELKNIQQKTGITFLFITHDQEEALSLSDRMGVMNRGHLEQIGKPIELYRRPTSRFVAEFLGEMNWIDGFGLRPEAIRVSRHSPADGVSHSRAVVQSTTFFGNAVYLHANLPDGATCTAQLDHNESDFAAGDPVYLSWRASDELRITQ
jgi:ABC-type Fe3+/spermidine/putrescine transport system ATPase subunit